MLLLLGTFLRLTATKRDGATLLIDKMDPQIAVQRYGSVFEAEQRNGKLFRASFACNYNHCPLPWPDSSVDCGGSDIAAELQDRRLFVLVWTSPSYTFTLRQFRVIESILYHHGPSIRIRVFSNTLPCQTFAHLDGMDVRVVRYDLKKLSQGLDGSEWADRLDEWSRGPFFYAHQSDYLRLVVMHRYGGVYKDFDSILVNQIPESAKNALFAIKCDTPKRGHCFRLAEFGSGWSSKEDLFYFPNGVMILQVFFRFFFCNFFSSSHQAGHAILKQSLAQFKSYNPKEWSCGAAYLSNAVRDLREKLRLGNFFSCVFFSSLTFIALVLGIFGMDGCSIPLLGKKLSGF